MWPLQQERAPMWKLTVTLQWVTLQMLHESVDRTQGRTYARYSLRCSWEDWLWNLMGMSVHNNQPCKQSDVWCMVLWPATLPSLVLRRVPGVNRMTEVTISEQMTRMTRRAIAIPFQFLCGGLLPTSSCRERQRGGEKTWSETVKRLPWEWIRERLEKKRMRTK